jgi:fructose-1,6-bisphosphatase/inositol monophosphatase family enzyme
MHWPPSAPRLLVGYWERNLQPWDIAAGQIMVQEAGGIENNPMHSSRHPSSAEVDI